MSDIRQLQAEIRAFVDERDWRQYHDPKNLASAISVEAAELLAIFRWLDDTAARTAASDPAQRRAIAHELADVLILSLEMADDLGLDAAQIVRDKLALNAAKYPVERSKGRAAKYTELGDA